MLALPSRRRQAGATPVRSTYQPAMDGPDANTCGASRNNAAIAAQASSRADSVNAAFHTVLTVHGTTPAQRAVVMALADIGVMPTPSPQLSMNANASTAGGTPSAAGLG